TNLGLCLLTFEAARLELGPDGGPPTTHQGFTPAPLIVARCLLPCYSPSPKIFNPVLSTTRCTGSPLLGAALADRLSLLPLRDKVVKCGTAISTLNSPAIAVIKPSVWRRGCFKSPDRIRKTRGPLRPR